MARFSHIPIDPNAAPIAHVSPYKPIDPSRPSRRTETATVQPDQLIVGAEALIATDVVWDVNGPWVSIQ